MNNRNQELEALLGELVQHKNYLESVENSYATVFNTKNKQLKSASFQHLQKQLMLLAKSSQKCLEHIQKHNDSLSKASIRTVMQTIGGIIEQFDQYLKPDIINKQTYNSYVELFDNLLNTHKLLSQKNDPVILQDEGKDKLLLKNLRGQINYIKKLNDNPENFNPQNIKKTTKRAENVALILSELAYKVQESPNSHALQKFLKQAFNEMEVLNIKVILNNTEDEKPNNKSPIKTDSQTKSVFQQAKDQNQIILKGLKRFNSALIYRYYFGRTDKAATALDNSILILKKDLLNLLDSGLYNELNTHLDSKIKNIDSCDSRELVLLGNQSLSFLSETIKSTQEVLASLNRFGHEDIDNKFMENIGNIHTKLTELRSVLTKKNTERSNKAQEWTKVTRQTKQADSPQDPIESPRRPKKE